jgi:D-xylose transport system ATP-binding protein
MMVTTAGDVPLVEMRDVSLSFGGVRAVDGASIDLYAGEVVALVGHNGAGKSTLIKILSGFGKHSHSRRRSGHR